MAVHTATGRGHTQQDLYHDVTNNADTYAVASASEVNSSGNPVSGAATVWVSNVWIELSNQVPQGMMRIHFRIHPDWGSDISWKVVFLTFKAGALE
jgi:hypothetical protein